MSGWPFGDHPVATEQHLKKGALEVGAHRLADDIGVIVVALHLHLRLTGRDAVDPGLAEQRVLGIHSSASSDGSIGERGRAGICS